MTENDILTLTVSSIALLFSVASTFISWRLQRKEMRTTVREQLTSVVQDLIGVRAKLVDVEGAAGMRPDAVGGERSAVLNHKLTSLARQACELDRIDPTVAFDVEFIAIAGALTISGDLATAETYQKRAIDRAPNAYYRALNIGLYGAFLFERFRYEEGRASFHEALAMVDGVSDDDKAAKLATYRNWLGAESRHFPPEQGQFLRCREEARALIQSFDSEPMRQSWLAQFDAEWMWGSAQVATLQLPDAPDAVAPDGSEVRLLLGLRGGGMAQFRLRPGQVSKAVTHRSVEEIWYFQAGHGQLWRRLNGLETVVEARPGTCITIPLGTEFQFRASAEAPLSALGITMPLWPGEGEAIEVAGPWQPTPA